MLSNKNNQMFEFVLEKMLLKINCHPQIHTNFDTNFLKFYKTSTDHTDEHDLRGLTNHQINDSPNQHLCT